MTSIPNVAVIPTRDHAETMCMDLLEQLLSQGECDRIFVFDNRDEPTAVEWSPRITWLPASGLTITELWNLGWRAAVEIALGDPVNVAFLNDDIVIPDNFMSTLASRLRERDDLWLVCPDYFRAIDEGVDLASTETVRGTYRSGGWCGWAFMIRGELLGDLPPLDEQFKWWCGDDDLDRQIAKAGGKCGLVHGLPLDHAGTATGRLYPELHELGWEDMKRFEEKYR